MKIVKGDLENDPSIPRVKENSHKGPTDESLKLIQKQLVLLLHSHSCLKKDLVFPNRTKCTVPNCAMMTGVWEHIKECKTGPECPHLHCLSSLKILAHYKHCKNLECKVCKLVRQKGAQQLQNQLGRQLETLPQTPQMKNSEGLRRILINNDLSGHPSLQIPLNEPILGQSTIQADQGLLSQCQGQLQPGNTSDDSYHQHETDSQTRFIHNYASHSHNPFHHAYNWRHKNESLISNLEGGPMQMSHFYSAVHPHPFLPYQYEMNYMAPFPYPHPQYNPSQCGHVECGNGNHLSTLGHQNFSQNFMISQQRQPDFENVFGPHFSSAPSATDVRLAYEQLGIPCPSDALKRLMATLPGGSKEAAAIDAKNSDSTGVGVTIARIRDSIDTDDGINDSMNIEGEDSFLCTSLIVHRLILNGKRQQIVASKSN